MIKATKTNANPSEGKQIGKRTGERDGGKDGERKRTDGNTKRQTYTHGEEWREKEIEKAMGRNEDNQKERGN